jgi:hypothetical protein
LAVANLANTNKELKPIGDVEYHPKGCSFSMVNGTLMAKGGQDQVNESAAALEPVAGTDAQVRGLQAPSYCDFAVPGAKPGEFALHAHFARGTKANQRYLGEPTGACLTFMPSIGRPLGRGR